VSGVTSECTTADVLRGVDLTGRTAVITGASSGLGLETARALQSVGCEVVAAVRDFDKTRAALDGAAVVALDLSDLTPYAARRPPWRADIRASICSSTTPV
jgi:NAD(P)-dependent dehydrogenase (short-subunit alcohol dehydrogenase family)